MAKLYNRTTREKSCKIPFQLRNTLMDCLSRLISAGEDDVNCAVSRLDDSVSQSFSGEGMSNDSVMPGTSSDFTTLKKGSFS